MSAYIDYVRVPTGPEAEDGFIDWYGTVAGWGFVRDSRFYNCTKLRL